MTTFVWLKSDRRVVLKTHNPEFHPRVGEVIRIYENFPSGENSYKVIEVQHIWNRVAPDKLQYTELSVMAERV